VEVTSQLVDAIRMLAQAEIIDHGGHCSVRHGAGSFQINSGASVRRVLTEADIVRVTLDGASEEGTAKPPLERHIHAEIYRARADVHAIMHTHPRWSTLLSMTGTPFQPVMPQAALLGPVPVLDSPLSVNTAEAGRRLATVLGDARAIFLKSHGAVIVGSDLIECFALAVYAEDNACRQYMALQIGQPYVFTEAEQQACRENLWSPGLFRKVWDHYHSMLASR
jgi:L-fuculose-phosphate aldolase